MPDVDWDKLVEMMRTLPPIRNVNAIRAWFTLAAPAKVAVFDHLVKDAALGKGAPKNIIMLMMAAFAAGRAYQAANPDAPRDPDGYGG